MADAYPRVRMSVGFIWLQTVNASCSSWQLGSDLAIEDCLKIGLRAD